MEGEARAKANTRAEAETRAKAATEPWVESETTTTSAAPLSMGRSRNERSREGQHNGRAELHVGLLLCRSCHYDVSAELHIPFALARRCERSSCSLSPTKAASPTSKRSAAAVARRVVPGLPRDALVEPRGWRCLTCHPPDHLPPEAIRREGEADDAPGPAASRAPDRDADPLFRQAGMSLDEEG
jgi:hypothetical protein